MSKKPQNLIECLYRHGNNKIKKGHVPNPARVLVYPEGYDFPNPSEQKPGRYFNVMTVDGRYRPIYEGRIDFHRGEPDVESVRRIEARSRPKADPAPPKKQKKSKPEPEPEVKADPPPKAKRKRKAKPKADPAPKPKAKAKPKAKKEDWREAFTDALGKARGKPEAKADPDPPPPPPKAKRKRKSKAKGKADPAPKGNPKSKAPPPKQSLGDQLRGEIAGGQKSDSIDMSSALSKGNLRLEVGGVTMDLEGVPQEQIDQFLDLIDDD
jgi:hypothetical protein